MANGYQQLGAALAGGGALPAAYAEAQGESLGANTQNAIAEAQGRLAKNAALGHIGDATSVFAAAPDASPEGQAKLGQALALATQAGVAPETLTKGVHGNQENNSYNTIVNPETSDAIVARHLAAEGKEGGLIRPTAAGEAATNILHPEQGVTTTPLGQALIPAKAGLLRSQAAAAEGTADLNHTKAKNGGFAGGAQGKAPPGTQWANDEDGNPVLDANGRPSVVPITGGPKDPNTPQPMGAVTSRYFQNSMNAGLQGATALSNAVRQPSGATAGLFADMKAGHTPLESLVRNATTAVTPEEDQNMNTILSGLEQNLAIVDNSGRVANQAYVDAMHRVVAIPGNTIGARYLKLAEARQVLENGLQSWADTASLNDQQKAALQRNLDTIQKAIPFTVQDVQGALGKVAPAPTIGDKIKSFFGGTTPDAARAAAPAAGATGDPFAPAPASAAAAAPAAAPAGPPAMSFKDEAQFNEAVARGKVPNNTRVNVGGRTATWTEE